MFSVKKMSRYIKKKKKYTLLYFVGDSICMGDRGAGLVAEYNEKYYIFGVLSFSPPSGIGKCDTSEYGLYTRVESYIDDFILEKVARYNTV
jgi:secreted trypsin-like serine protease